MGGYVYTEIGILVPIYTGTPLSPFQIRTGILNDLATQSAAECAQESAKYAAAYRDRGRGGMGAGEGDPDVPVAFNRHSELVGEEELEEEDLAGDGKGRSEGWGDECQEGRHHFGADCERYERGRKRLGAVET